MTASELAPGPLGPAVAADPSHEFWVRHLRLGSVIFVGETLVVMAYLGLTPDGPHRAVLWPMVACWLVVGSANLWAAPRVAARPWRATFSVAWTVLSAIAAGAVASLDHGRDSPLLFLLFLPLAWAALAFTPRAAALCAVSGLASAAFVAVTGPTGAGSADDFLILLAALGGVAVLSVAASANRARLERHEHQLIAAIVEMAEVDGLTGCAVPRVFRRRTNQEAARSMRNDRPLSLLMIDVDKFKSINDTCGHPVGDRVLAAIGAVLRSNTRSFDLAGRVGGDEFAVLVPDAGPEAAVALADRIRRQLTRSVEVPVTLSIGVSGLDPLSPSVEQLAANADRALYEAKERGGDGVAVWHPDAVAPGG